MPKLKDSFTFRIDRELSRKFRALAKVYGALPGEFVRDLLEATIVGGLEAQLFEHRLKKGMERYKDKPVLVDGPDAGGFTAPGQPALSASKAKKRRKEPPVP